MATKVAALHVPHVSGVFLHAFCAEAVSGQSPTVHHNEKMHGDLSIFPRLPETPSYPAPHGSGVVDGDDHLVLPLAGLGASKPDLVLTELACDVRNDLRGQHKGQTQSVHGYAKHKPDECMSYTTAAPMRT